MTASTVDTTAPQIAINDIGSAEDLLAARDLLFYADVADEATLLMRPGSFAVFLPTDVHRPACAFDGPEAIRKVVMKV